MAQNGKYVATPQALAGEAYASGYKSKKVDERVIVPEVLKLSRLVTVSEVASSSSEFSKGRGFPVY